MANRRKRGLLDDFGTIVSTNINTTQINILIFFTITFFAIVSLSASVCRAEEIECGKIYQDGAKAAENSDFKSALEKYTASRECFLKASGGIETIMSAEVLPLIGSTRVSLGDYQQAMKDFKNALKIDAALYGEESAATGRDYDYIGTLYQNNGDYPRAVENLEKSLAISLKVLGPNDPAMAIRYNNIGALQYWRGEYRKAIDYYNKALSLDLKYDGDESDAASRDYNNLGAAFMALGEYQRAREYYEKVLAIDLKSKGANDPSTAITYNNIGVLTKRMGDYPRAIEYYKMALAVDKAVYGDSGADTARDYNNLGLAFAAMDDNGAALENYDKALSTYEKLYGPEHPSIAIVYNNIGLSEVALEKWDAALKHYEKALAADLKNLGARHPETADAYNNIAGVLDRKGNYKLALKNYQKALSIAHDVYGDDVPKIAQYYFNTGAAWQALGNSDRALENYEKALKPLCGGKSDPKVADCPPSMDAVNVFWWKGRALAFYKKYGDLKEKLSAAALAFENAAASLDALRDSMSGDSARKIHGSEYYSMFPEGIEVYALLAQVTKDKSVLERAFEFAEKGIGRVFLEMIGRGRAEISGGLPREVIAKGSALKAKWQSALDAVQSIEAKPKSEIDPSERRAAYQELLKAEAALKAHEEELLKKYPRYAELMKPRTRSLAEIRGSVIGRDEAALEYILGDNGSWLIFITRDKLRAVELPQRSGIERDVRAFVRLLKDQNSSELEIKITAARLYGILIGPVAKDLVEYKSLLIVPTGELYFLPFEALVIPDKKTQKYLLSEYSIRYAPSLNTLYLTAKTDVERSDAGGAGSGRTYSTATQWIGFGDPVYQPDCDERARGRSLDDAAAGMVRSYSRSMSETGGDGDRGSAWCRIPATAEEVKTIGAMFGAAEGAGTLNLGYEASAANFKKHAPEGYRYVHIATHGTLGEGGANQPALVLSLIGNPPGESGFLTMTDVFNMKTPAEMVVLSACKTGQGKMEKGEGVAGMSRAFLYAGADSIVVSLWSVADKETKDLMVDFYTKLTGGMKREASLREAKLDMIKRNPHPFFWAPFIYVGND